MMQRPGEDDDDNRPPSRKLLLLLEGETESGAADKADLAMKDSICTTSLDKSHAGTFVDEKSKAESIDQSVWEKDAVVARKKAKRKHSSETEACGKLGGQKGGMTTQRSSDSAPTTEDKESTNETKSSDKVDMEAKEMASKDDDVPQGCDAARRNDSEAPLGDMASLLYTDNIMAAAAATNEELEAAAILEEEEMRTSRRGSNASSRKKPIEPKRSHSCKSSAASNSTVLIQRLVTENEELKRRNMALEQDLNATKQLLLRLLSQPDLISSRAMQPQLGASITGIQLDLQRNLIPSAASNLAGTVLQQPGSRGLGHEALLSLLAKWQVQQQQPANAGQLLQQQLQPQENQLLSQNLGAMGLQQHQGSLWHLQQQLLFSQGSQLQQFHASSPNLSAILSTAATQEALQHQQERQLQEVPSASTRSQETKDGQEDPSRQQQSSGRKPVYKKS
jgi:hypothetical protein